MHLLESAELSVTEITIALNEPMHYVSQQHVCEYYTGLLEI